MLNRLLFILLLLLIVSGGVVAGIIKRNVSPATPSPEPAEAQNNLNSVLTTPTDAKRPITTIAQNLNVPWSLAFMPNGDILFTERAGKVRVVEIKNNQVKDIATLNEMKQGGEGGLLGLALHPQFAKNNYIYLYYTYGNRGEDTLNRVERYTLNNNTLSEKRVIVDAIPGANFHNGGRIKFGPDNHLYITTGDAQEPSLSQDTKQLAGKILRVTDEGKPIADNPFNNAIYSYGHRNPQGLAWDATGQLWVTEHGPSMHDELNKAEKGANYGWPTIVGEQRSVGVTPPIIESGNSTWAPSGLAFANGKLYFVGLRGQALYVYDPAKGGTPQEIFKQEYGRLRDVVIGPDNALYLLTNNRDGRGTPQPDDDKILKLTNF